MMFDALQKFPQQLLHEVSIHNEENLKHRNRLVVCGMGGSHLSADIFNTLQPHIISHVHTDYGLPDLTDAEARESLYVMSSYSGNTEEVLEAYELARNKKYSIAVMAVGGTLIERAKRDEVPYIEFPNVGIQPRAALGYGVMGFVRLTNQLQLESELRALHGKLNIDASDHAGRELAAALKGSVPIIYSSMRNAAIAQNWKIKFNENTKIPAFWNAIPELNHNEMTGFDVVDSTRELSQKFHVIMLRDSEDHPRNQRRMEITADLYQQRSIAVRVIEMQGTSRAEKVYNSLMLGDWTSVHLGEMYGVETEQVPMVEEFKKLIR